uniref:Uncharacterized protein n=1 Tax=Heterorhabditis bacteriophora TaxID=37862 RepID=A0A1I7WJZ3_HETBA
MIYIFKLIKHNFNNSLSSSDTYKFKSISSKSILLLIKFKVFLIILLGRSSAFHVRALYVYGISMFLFVSCRTNKLSSLFPLNHNKY